MTLETTQDMTSPDASPVGLAFEGHVAIVELRRPPHNFFDMELITTLAATFETLDHDSRCRAIVLCSQGSAFSAGGNFAATGAPASQPSPRAVNPIYDEAIRMFSCAKPVVAAVHGPAVGGGLGLALVADFRVTCAQARFSANFARLGFHAGFGLSVTLPRLVGLQKAALLFYTGRRIGGEEAVSIGLADLLVPQDHVRAEALRLAAEIAESAPLAVVSMRATLRAGLVDQVRLAVARESEEQNWQFRTDDCKEGIAATAQRRVPKFQGR